MKRILITGAAGFIGSHVCRALIGKNEIIASISPYSDPWRLEEIENKIAIEKTDLVNVDSVRGLFIKHKPEIVVHLATHGVYSSQQNDTGRIVKDNYLMTLNLLECSKEFKVEKFINTGSVFEYGTQKKEVKEDDISLSDVINLYSAVKIATTVLVCSYSDLLEVITLRPFTAYGPKEDESRLIRASIQRALKGEPIRVVPGVVRDFIYIGDIASAYQQAIDCDTFSSGEIVNIGSGKKVSLRETAEVIRHAAKSKSEIIFDTSFRRRKESACWANILKAEKILNWQPKHTLEQGIKATLDWVASKK